METVLRPIKTKDVSAFCKLLKTLDGETDFFMYGAGERSLSPVRIKRRIAASRRDKSGMIFIALDGKKLLGHIGIFQSTPPRKTHEWSLVVGVLKEYNGQGIGTRLLQAAEKFARKNGAYRIELGVMSNNTRAIQLYRKLGFKMEGRKQRSLRIRGKYIDEYIMAKLF